MLYQTYLNIITGWLEPMLSQFHRQCFIKHLNINFTGWLEPMLSRIGEDKRHVVTPIIESIEADNFKINMSDYKEIQVGKFNWNMAFSWMPVPNSIKKRLSSKVMPIRFVIG